RPGPHGKGNGSGSPVRRLDEQAMDSDPRCRTDSCIDTKYALVSIRRGDDLARKGGIVEEDGRGVADLAARQGEARHGTARCAAGSDGGERSGLEGDGAVLPGLAAAVARFAARYVAG